MDLLVPTLQTFAVLGIGFGTAILALVLFRRKGFGGSGPKFDSNIFSPSELERLKGMGLLTDDEAKRVQSIVTSRTMKQLEKEKAPKEDLGLNELLAEAERFRRERLKQTETSEEDRD